MPHERHGIATHQPADGQPVSGWAAGGITFAACVLTLVGAFQIVAGLTAIIDDEFIPYYPFWAILLIALNVWVIWSLTRPGAIRT